MAIDHKKYFWIGPNQTLYQDPKTGLVFADIVKYEEFLKKIGYSK